MIDTSEQILDHRLRTWIYFGVETELEMAELFAENDWLRENDPQSEDISWNKKRIFKLQAKMELVNERLSDLMQS